MTHLTPAIKRSLVSILEKAGEDYTIMDENGGICCGRPMLMAGRADAAQQMIDKNTGIILSSGATTLLLSCPICYRIFKENYKLDGIVIMHHTEYIKRLISEKRIDISKSDIKFAYHDPCELGRGCGIYEEPRDIIRAAGELLEGAKSGAESICCGGSLGSLSLGDEQRKRLIENALNNLTTASPDAIVTACPLCKNTFKRHSAIPVIDIAEVALQAIEKK
jgi:Fe-S oxidoreductase